MKGKNMGYRHVTKNEFVYIKDLLKKYKKIGRVAKLASRSPITVARIKEVNSILEFKEARKTPVKTSHSQKPVSQKVDINNNISSEILKELTAIRKGIFVLNNTISKLNTLFFILNEKKIDYRGKNKINFADLFLSISVGIMLFALFAWLIGFAN